MNSDHSEDACDNSKRKKWDSLADNGRSSSNGSSDSWSQNENQALLEHCVLNFQSSTGNVLDDSTENRWELITHAINAAGEKGRTIEEVKARWSVLQGEAIGIGNPSALAGENSLKRKLPVKRKSFKNSKKSTSSGSGGEGEQDFDTENSSGENGIALVNISALPLKRGRKPREDSISPISDIKKRNAFHRKPKHILKKTLESFLQDGSCNEVAPKLGKCRECCWSSVSRAQHQTHPLCRFYAFRKLRYTKNGQLAIAGFSDPFKDAGQEDLDLWLPSKETLPEVLKPELCTTLISQLGDQFCDLVREEREALNVNLNPETKSTAVWKRVVSGVRDMCDVCETTLFNFHWSCGKCGFVVCFACYKSRNTDTIKVYNRSREEVDIYNWLLCSSKQSHELDKLMLTQVIAGDSLNELGKLVHQIRHEKHIPQYCDCPEASVFSVGNNKQEQAASSQSNGLKKVEKEIKSDSDSSSDDSDDDTQISNFLDLINNSIKVDSQSEVSSIKQMGKDAESSKAEKESSENGGALNGNTPLKHFVRSTASNYHRKLLPIRTCTLCESTITYPSLPHSWLCSGRLLRLEDPSHHLNMEIFQDVWKRGQPVLVGNVDSVLSKSLWTPESFSRDFSELKNDLVNCISGKTLANQSIRRFWDGFDYVKKRLMDDKGNPMLLKLKDWPPGDDFAEVLPERFRDLMAALPLSDYTVRHGHLNLAARLPNKFVKPDLGPKMYIAYGSGLHLDKGTTNLHLDISDAVNVMVHVGVPKDVDNTDHMNAVREAIKDSDCDMLTIQKVLEKGERAGALWHIYNSRDADKIRDLLNKVAMERGDRLEPNHDPIHDQSWYLDTSLRKRLMDEYDVSGYPIVQCLGDAVFIPAGAPHQVRNLNNCIKIAEDFVSPENVSHCFDLTEEFRRLSDTHQNHEDKLQIKNIIYHAVKDAVSVLLYGNNSPTETSHEISPPSHNNSNNDSIHRE